MIYPRSGGSVIQELDWCLSRLYRPIYLSDRYVSTAHIKNSLSRFLVGSMDLDVPVSPASKTPIGKGVCLAAVFCQEMANHLLLAVPISHYCNYYPLPAKLMPHCLVLPIKLLAISQQMKAPLEIHLRCSHFANTGATKRQRAFPRVDRVYAITLAPGLIFQGT